MAQNSRYTLESGNEYSLKELFSGKIRIIIPDLQRDYCWGDKAWDVNAKRYNELVTAFVKNLLSNFHDRPNERITLGLVYGYEQPQGHIQLCDGQQRITTLFLLLGILNKRAGNIFNEYLISKEEQDDDFEPNLQYAIRETTLYFLSDLCRNVFIGTCSEDKIKTAPWYFQEYEQDSSIQSMLKALKTISGVLDEENDVSYEELYRYLLEKVRLLYYDMETRQRGEETYVVINTTGEPLSATENVKPVLLGELKGEKLKTYSEQWENREDWFWFRRGNDKTSDNGLKAFFIWYWQIGLLQEKTGRGENRKEHDAKLLFTEPPKNAQFNDDDSPEMSRYETYKTLDQVNLTFKALEQLVAYISKSEKSRKVLSSIPNKISLSDKECDVLSWLRNANLNVVLPLISYCEKFPECELLDLYMRRIRRNFFDVERKDSGRKRFVIDWRHLIQIVENASSEKEVLEYDTIANTDKFKTIPNIPLNEWFNEDERNKSVLKQEGYKDEIEIWEDCPDIQGDLSVLWAANEGKSITFENVKPIWERFSSLYDSLNINLAKSNPKLSNSYRLFRVLYGIIKIEHQSYMSWEHEGCRFSERLSSYSWLQNQDFIALLSSPDLNYAIDNAIRIKLQELKDSSFDNNKVLLKYWIAGHVLHANKKSVCLSLYDDYALSIYKSLVYNKLNPNIDGYPLGNLICGYGGRYDIWYAGQEYWNNPSCLDTPIKKNISRKEFNERENKPISEEIIKEQELYVRELIDDFINRSSSY